MRKTENLVGSRRIAEFLGVSYSTLQMLRDKEGLPCYRVKGQYRYSIADVQKWLERSMREGIHDE